RFFPTSLQSVTIIERDAVEDLRGSFARIFCRDELAAAGIGTDVVQANISHNHKARTLRGLHYQEEPSKELKIVSCTRGRIWDAVLDLRPSSLTFCRWIGLELSPRSGRSVYIPPGCAHGFLTLEDDCDVLYLMGAAYEPCASRGVRWNDPAFAIAWPAEP